MAASKKTARVALKGDLSVHNASAVRTELLDALAKSVMITVDFSGLEDFDVAILQLLVALIAEAGLQNRQVSFEGPFSPAVRQCMYVSGFIASVNVPDEKIYEQFSTKAGKNHDR